MSNMPKGGAVRLLAQNVTSVLWSSLTDEQKARAADKYFSDGEEWENTEEFFTYEPDSFLTLNGDVLDINAEATLITDSETYELFDAHRQCVSLRYFPSSIVDKTMIVIRYNCLIENPTFDIFIWEYTK